MRTARSQGLYAKARSVQISQFTGVSDPFEIQHNPDIIIHTEDERVEEATERIFAELMIQFDLLRLNLG